MLDLFAGLNRDAGLTILLATHAQELAAAADDIVHLREAGSNRSRPSGGGQAHRPCGSLDSSSSAASHRSG